MDDFIKELTWNTLNLSLDGISIGSTSGRHSLIPSHTQVNRAPLKYLVLSVDNIPTDANANNLYELFSKYGRVHSLNLERSEYQDTIHSGHGTVCYQPVPNPLPEFLDIGAQPLKLFDIPLHIEVLDDGQDNDADESTADAAANANEKHSWTRFNVASLEVGSQIKNSGYLSHWKFVNTVKFEIAAQAGRCRISFKHFDTSHRFELYLHDSPCRYRLWNDEKKSKDHLKCDENKLDVPTAMTLYLRLSRPPRVWRKEERAARSSLFFYDRRDVWKRITRMTTTCEQFRPANDDQVIGSDPDDSVPNGEIQLGAWLDYRLKFRFKHRKQRKHAFQLLSIISGGQLYGMQRMSETDTISAPVKSVPTEGDTNEDGTEYAPHSGWVLPTNAIFTQLPAMPDLMQHEVNYARLSDVHISYYSVRYLLEHYVTTRVFSKYAIEHKFLKLLANEKSEEIALEALKRLASDEHRSGDLTQNFKKCLMFIRADMERKELIDESGIGRSILPSYCITVRKAIVTPTKVFLLAPTVETSNRVLRQFEKQQDRFLRVQFFDDDFQRIGSNKRMFEDMHVHIKRVLKNGLRIAGLHFEFLAFSSSQLREHGCWFFAEDRKQDNVTVERIREWMGDFSKIKQVALYAARMGQCFSGTRNMHGLKIDHIQDKEEVTRNGYVFSDGVGCASPAVADYVKKALNLSRRPSAFQFRLGGCKGMLSVDPQLQGNTIAIRPSQRKFDSTHTKLEIVKHAAYAPGYLNRQIITLLTALGIPSDVIIERKDREVLKLESMLSNPNTAIGVLQHHASGCPVTRSLIDLIKLGLLARSEPYVYNLLQLFRACLLRDIREKARIQISDSVSLLGILDETGLLGADQIFVQFSDPALNRNRTLVGQCAVLRNPAIHPGDIRVVNAVDIPELHDYVNCIVFSQHGDRDIPNQCGGGDLDGDEFTCIWDDELIPKQMHTPMSYVGVREAKRDRVTIDDIQDFFINYIINDNLGRISNAHLAQADQLPGGAKHHTCLTLANLHSCAVDFPKSGVPAQLPRDLLPVRTPDFMNKNHMPTYVSTSPIGIIYRSITPDEFKPRTIGMLDERFLTRGYEICIDEAAAAKRDYDATIRDIMQQFEISSEWEVISGWVISFSQIVTRKAYDLRIELGQIVRGVQREFKRRFEAEFAAELKEHKSKHAKQQSSYWRAKSAMPPELRRKLRQKAAAWYFVTYDTRERQLDSESNQLFSFPWIVHEYLCENASSDNQSNE